MIRMIWNDWDDFRCLSEPGWAGFLGFGVGCLGIRVEWGCGWLSPSGPAPPRALAPALSRRAGEGGGFGLGSLSFCEGRFASFRGAWAVHERPLRVAVMVFAGGVGGMAVFLGVRWWLGESFWLRASPRPHPGPLPRPAGEGVCSWRMAVLVGDWGMTASGWFCEGESFFLRRALRFLRGAWAVLERPLRGGGSGVLEGGLWDGGLFAGCGVALGESFWPRPCIPRSLRSRPFRHERGGGTSLPPRPSPQVGSFAQPVSTGVFGVRRRSIPLCPSDISP